MATVFDVAEYILAKYLADEELADDPVTHMKLQKLVYYAQGFSLALDGEPRFAEPLEAWQRGPVCPELYHVYKHLGKQPVLPVLTLAEAGTMFSLKQIEVMALVIALYGQLTAATLRSTAHADAAWRDAFDKGGSRVLEWEAIRHSCERRLAVKMSIRVPTKEEGLAHWRLADESGLPDSLEEFEAFIKNAADA
jgi:uncharacterized phage-associated protein